MLIVGLTGGIASGKSTVAVLFERKGAYVLDADRLAREAVEPDQPAWQEIVNWLGGSILNNDRTIDRVKLANLVFRDRKKLDRLNSIVHPWVGARFVHMTAEIREKEPAAVVVYDVPLLVEAGLHKTVDRVVLVIVPRETQVARLMERDGISRVDAELRLKSQASLEEKKKYAHYTIDNSGAPAATTGQVDRVWEELQENRP